MIPTSCGQGTAGTRGRPRPGASPGGAGGRTLCSSYRNLIPAPNWTPSHILEKGQKINTVAALRLPPFNSTNTGALLRGTHALPAERIRSRSPPSLTGRCTPARPPHSSPVPGGHAQPDTGDSAVRSQRQRRWSPPTQSSANLSKVFPFLHGSEALTRDADIYDLHTHNSPVCQLPNFRNED